MRYLAFAQYLFDLWIILKVFLHCFHEGLYHGHTLRIRFLIIAYCVTIRNRTYHSEP